MTITIASSKSTIIIPFPHAQRKTKQEKKRENYTRRYALDLISHHVQDSIESIIFVSACCCFQCRNIVESQRM